MNMQTKKVAATTSNDSTTTSTTTDNKKKSNSLEIQDLRVGNGPEAKLGKNVNKSKSIISF